MGSIILPSVLHRKVSFLVRIGFGVIEFVLVLEL